MTDDPTRAGRSGRKVDTWAFRFVAAFATAGLVILAAAAVGYPGRQDQLPAWLQPEAPLTAVAVGAAVVAAFLLDAIPRWRRGQRRRIPALALAAVIAAALGLAATARCTDNEDWFLTPLWNTMTMFVGTSPDMFGPGGNCPSGVPLALQLGRFAALAAVFGAAIGVVLSLLSERVNVVRDTFATYRTVVIGADAAALPLIDTLRAWSDSLGPVVVLAWPVDAGGAELARSTGVTVRILAEPAGSDEPGAVDRASLSRYLTRRGRATAEAVWVMDADPARAIRIGEAARDLLADADRSALHAAPQVLVRIDDRRTADRLRTSWVLDDGVEAGQPIDPRAPVIDPICAVEVTAAELVGRAALAFRDVGSFTLVVCGDTPLAEAIVAEIGTRMWESSALQKAWHSHQDECQHLPRCRRSDLDQAPGDLLVGGRLPTQVILLSETADRMAAQVLRSLPFQQRLHLPNVVRRVQGDWRTATSEEIDEATHLAFVIAEPVATIDAHLPARLFFLAEPEARRRGLPRKQRVAVSRTDAPTVRVFLQPAHAVSATAESVNPGEEGYVDNILLAGRLPEGSWIRAARHLHEKYRRTNWKPGKATRLPWWAPEEAQRLPVDVRADNLEAIRQLLRSVAELGWTWQRDIDARTTPAFGWDELERLRGNEYLRWRAGQKRMAADLENCPPIWPGPATQDEKEQEHRDFTSTTVATALEILGGYGYVPVPGDGSRRRS